MPTVLSFDRISFSRSDGENTRLILTDISWSVGRGEIAAILGANGCGKSTLLRLACAYLWPLKGTVKLLGETLGEVAVADLRKRIGIVEATSVYPFDENMTAWDVVVSGYFSALTLGYITPTVEQWEHAAQLLLQVGLGPQARQAYATMSTGQRMRALIARALVRKPELLILDEPTNGLDLPSREAVLATLARIHAGDGVGKNAPAMITVTHHLEELLPGTENVLLLSTHGTIVAQGTPEKVLTSENMTAAYGVDIGVTHRDGRYHAHVDPRTWSDLL